MTHPLGKPMATRRKNNLVMRAATLGVALFVAGSVMGGTTHVEANARDADGSRMQARAIKLGTTQRDTLRPPSDRVDWRSVKLSKATRLSVTVSHKGDNAVQLRLTDSRGQAKGSATSRKGRGAVSASLEPGIYYISVSAKAPICAPLASGVR